MVFEGLLSSVTQTCKTECQVAILSLWSAVLGFQRRRCFRTSAVHNGPLVGTQGGKGWGIIHQWGRDRVPPQGKGRETWDGYNRSQVDGMSSVMLPCCARVQGASRIRVWDGGAVGYTCALEVFIYLIFSKDIFSTELGSLPSSRFRLGHKRPPPLAHTHFSESPDLYPHFFCQLPWSRCLGPKPIRSGWWSPLFTFFQITFQIVPAPLLYGQGM